MARRSSFSLLAALNNRVDRRMAEMGTASPAHLRGKMIDMAGELRLSVVDLFGNGRNGDRKGRVVPKDRDPNSGSRWTGRGRMPRWMVAATKGGSAKNEDILI